MTETSRIETGMYPGEKYRLPLLIGAGILMIYFVLFAFTSYGSFLDNEIYFLFYGEYNDQYVAMKEIMLTAMSLLVLVIGLPIFMRGLRKMRQARKEGKDKGLVILNIVFIGIQIIIFLIIILDTVGFSYVTFVGPHPVFIGWTFILVIYYFRLVLFPIVIILVGIQSYLLRKKELYTHVKVKRQIVPYIMWCSLLAWLISMIIYHAMGYSVENIVALSAYTGSQLSTSLLAAGVYLELVLKIDNSYQVKNLSG